MMCAWRGDDTHEVVAPKDLNSKERYFMPKTSHSLRRSGTELANHTKELTTLHKILTIMDYSSCTSTVVPGTTVQLHSCWNASYTSIRRCTIVVCTNNKF
jgi:hypothetical protein